MKHLKLFREFVEFPYEKISDTQYEFYDNDGNQYKVNFDGEFEQIWVEDENDRLNPIESGKTYDLEFVTGDNDFLKLTNAGNPFSISNLIFGKILKDFISSKNPDTINIEPTPPEDEASRYDKKKHSKYYLYLRTLNREFKNSDWKIIKLEYNSEYEDVKRILLVNTQSDFWKKNLDNLLNSLSDKINELKVTSRTSSSGRTKEVDVILDEPSSSRTLSSSILLRKKLKEEELESELGDIMDITSVKSSPKRKVSLHKIKPQIVRQHERRMDKLLMLINNMNFLKDQLEENGVLKCEYCGTGPLYIYDPFTKDEYQQEDENEYIRHTNFRWNGATCDHKDPRSKGGHVFDYDNLAVCCRKCNLKKGNKSYANWLEILKNKKLKEE